MFAKKATNYDLVSRRASFGKLTHSQFFALWRNAGTSFIQGPAPASGGRCEMQGRISQQPAMLDGEGLNSFSAADCE
jgi:hypothetical protein